MCGHGDRIIVVFHFKAGLFSVPYHPKQNGIHVHRNQIAGKGLFCRKAGEHDALVGFKGDVVDKRDGEVQTRACCLVVLAQAKDHVTAPFGCDVQGGAHKQRQDEARAKSPDVDRSYNKGACA